MTSGRMMRGLIGTGQTYQDKVLGYNPTAYWPLDELAGGVAQDKVVDLRAPNPASLDGAYTGVTLNDTPGPDGRPTPLFDGLNDFVDIVALQPAWLPDESTLMIWLKVFNAGVWTDGSIRYAFSIFANSKQYDISKANAPNNTLHYETATENVSHNTAVTTWICAVFIRSVSAGVDGQMIAYYNGVQTGVIQTSLAAWGDPTFLAGWHAIGAGNTVPNAPFHGWLAHVAVWAGTVLTPTQIADLAVIP